MTSHFDEEVIQIMAEEETVLRDPHLDALIGCHVTSEIVVKCVRRLDKLLKKQAAKDMVKESEWLRKKRLLLGEAVHRET